MFPLFGTLLRGDPPVVYNAAGINISSYDQSSFDVYARLRFNTNGTRQHYYHNYPTGPQYYTATPWSSDAPGETGGSGLYVRVRYVSGVNQRDASGLALNTWYDLSTAREWIFKRTASPPGGGATVGTYDLSISTTASDAGIIDGPNTFNVTLTEETA